MAKQAEAYVVNGLCQTCMDTACAQVCPVECFYVPKNPTPDLPLQLYIRPSECINCNACVPACPWEAITDGESVPDVFEKFIDLNTKTDEAPDEFDHAPILKWQACSQCRSRTSDGQPKCQCGAPLKPFNPLPDEVAVNKAKWNYKG